ncbi:MAG: hypothetical protein M1833_004978 [Piccolia ochrophora]|nr:MAG: hypothetical protein M1833_004978 [Piccolia ochrophora]
MEDSEHGLGNLADELADAWDAEGEEEDHDRSSFDADVDGITFQGTPSRLDFSSTRDKRIDRVPPPEAALQYPSSPSPLRSTHRQEWSKSQTTNAEPSNVSSTLDIWIKAIESLNQKCSHKSSADDDAIPLLIASLKDLGGQASVESGTTRLITTHTALTSHLTHQTRTLHSLTYLLLSPLPSTFSPLSNLDPDPLLILLAPLSDLLPTPSIQPPQNLHALTTLTTDLLTSLSAVSDTLHESRQATTVAARKLRATLEMVREMRREDEEADEGRRWIERGRWEDRLGRRECAEVVREVVGGFEEVCGRWRNWIESGGGGSGFGGGLVR